jgi:hypothetical protein
MKWKRAPDGIGRFPVTIIRQAACWHVPGCVKICIFNKCFFYARCIEYADRNPETGKLY